MLPWRGDSYKIIITSMPSMLMRQGQDRGRRQGLEAWVGGSDRRQGQGMGMRQRQGRVRRQGQEAKTGQGYEAGAGQG